MCALMTAMLMLVADVCPGPTCRPGFRPPLAAEGRTANPTHETARTPNFVVHAQDAAVAKSVADWAEAMRTELIQRWSVVCNPAFRRNLPAEPPPEGGTTNLWSRPVTITVYRDHPGYFATEFGNDGVVSITLWAGDVHLESTVRHEVCHAVLHLRYPHNLIPRWFDEGLAVYQESPVEQQRQLAPLFRAPRRFSVRQLSGLTEYPREIPLFYAQSYSLMDFLVKRHGEPELLRFLETSFKVGQENALRQVLGYASFENLDQQWWAEIKK